MCRLKQIKMQQNQYVAKVIFVVKSLQEDKQSKKNTKAMLA